jgi:hypothetical protein
VYFDIHRLSLVVGLSRARSCINEAKRENSESCAHTTVEFLEKSYLEDEQSLH